MKFGVVNKSTILNRFVLHTLQRNIAHLAVITCKTNIKFDILKGGETGKEPRKNMTLKLFEFQEFFEKINPNWENWINAYTFYSAVKPQKQYTLSKLVGDHVFLDLYSFAGLFFHFPTTSHMHQFYVITRGLTRLSMKTKYVFHSPISTHINFCMIGIKWTKFH